MSQESWNRGLDDAANGEEFRQPYSSDMDYCAGYDYGSPRHDDREPPPPEYDPEPTEEDWAGECEADGHQLFGIDEIGPRCYCGKKRNFEEPK